MRGLIFNSRSTAAGLLMALVFSAEAGAIQSQSVTLLAGNSFSVPSGPCQLIQMPEPLAPGVAQNFQGIDNVTGADGKYAPADTTIAAGPNHIVAVANRILTIFGKDGTCVRQVPLLNWFTAVCTGCNPNDPRIVYDPREGHWIMVSMYRTSSTSNLLLSVSQGSDPTTTWWNWSLDGKLFFGGDTFADFPDIGFDNLLASQNGALYVTSNQFFFTGGLPQTALLFILPKSALYAGSAFTCWKAWGAVDFDGTTQSFTLRPARMYGVGNPLSPVEYMMNSKRLGGTGDITGWKVVPTFPPTPLNWTNIPNSPFIVGTYARPPVAGQQLCPSPFLSTSDNRLLDAIWRNNKLYIAFTAERVFPSGTVAAVRYVTFDTTTFTSVKRTHSLEGANFFYPAICPDAMGNIFIAHARSQGGSTPADFASMWFTGEKTTDSGPQAAALLKSGATCVIDVPIQDHPNAHWGDYFGAAPDEPDESRVWVYGSWAKPLAEPNGGNWGTWIALLTFGPDFSVSNSPTSLILPIAGSATSVVTVTSLSGFSAAVSLSCTGLPAGITCGFSPASVTPPAGGVATSNVTVSASAAVTPGTYAIQVSGSSGGQVRKNGAQLIVQVADYSIIVVPTALNVRQGTSSMATVNVNSISNYSAAVTLSIGSVFPTGVSGGFASNPVTPPGNGTASSVLTLTAASNALVGPSLVRISGSVTPKVRGFSLGLSVLTPTGLGTGSVGVDTHSGPGTVSNLNGVFEPGESVMAATGWSNQGSGSVGLTGTAANFTGPAGATYTLVDASAGYGTLVVGATANCFDATANCYVLQVSNPGTRPAAHWDATDTETLSTGEPKNWTVHIGNSFSDAPTSNSFYSFIETMLHTGITAGCGGGAYCPTSSVTRGQMAVFLVKAEHGSAFTPPPCTGIFADVPCPGGFADWIELVSNEGITGGCGGGNYCPNNPVTRAQMAVFLLKAEHGPSYVPPMCSGLFADVACPSPFANWIEQLVAEGITGGCGGSNFCPNSAVTRGQMAVFLTKTFKLVLYN